MPLLNDLVDLLTDRVRYREAKGFRRRKVQDRLELAWRLNRQFGGLRALEYAVGVTGGAPVQIGKADAVGQQAARLDEIPEGVDRWQPVRRRKPDDKALVGLHDRIAADD